MASAARKKSRALVPVSVKNDSLKFNEYVVRRDNDVSLSFAGIQLAMAYRETDNVDEIITLEAAFYKTRGGKFITTLSKTVADPFADDEDECDCECHDYEDDEEECGFDCNCECDCEDDSAEWNSGYHKAAVHDTFEEAVQWFRPGRLTDEIRRQLGLDKPIRIE
jgi:hypothetical protein